MHRRAYTGQAAPAGCAPNQSKAIFAMVGLIGTSLAAAGQEDVSEASEEPFAVEEIKVPGELAPNFLARNIQLGKGNDRVVSDNSVPFTLFSHKTPYIPREWGVLRSQQNLTASITNNSQAASTFRAGVYGYAAAAIG